jgi:hypothetical protein
LDVRTVWKACYWSGFRFLECHFVFLDRDRLRPTLTIPEYFHSTQEYLPRTKEVPHIRGYKYGWGEHQSNLSEFLKVEAEPCNYLEQGPRGRYEFTSND